MRRGSWRHTSLALIKNATMARGTEEGKYTVVTAVPGSFEICLVK